MSAITCFALLHEMLPFAHAFTEHFRVRSCSATASLDAALPDRRPPSLALSQQSLH